jgi:hypothetical protein
LAVAGLTLMSAQVPAQQIKPPDIDYRPVISDLNAIAASWNLKELTIGNVAVVGAVGSGTARLALREQYAAKMASYFKSIDAKPDGKLNHAEFVQAEQRLFEKAGASREAIAFLSYRLKIRPPKDGNTFDVAAFNERVTAAEALSCAIRVQTVVAASNPAPPESARHAECIFDFVLGLSVAVLDTGIQVFGPEVAGPILPTIIAWSSGSWAWDEVKDGWNCK